MLWSYARKFSSLEQISLKRNRTCLHPQKSLILWLNAYVVSCICRHQSYNVDDVPSCDLVLKCNVLWLSFPLAECTIDQCPLFFKLVIKWVLVILQDQAQPLHPNALEGDRFMQKDVCTMYCRLSPMASALFPSSWVSS